MPRKLKATLLKNLKKIREDRSLSQKKVAEGLGIAQSYYCDMENGISEISAVRLWQISKLLDVDMESFFDEGQVRNAGNDRLRQRLESMESKVKHLELSLKSAPGETPNWQITP